ncbi:mitochondrial exoribonuclease Cyt-4 [Arthroderma uncinatum]|uniref:mitochondrial exoribonuclease Cyt-4 n=1 Tax=Arthroderma uncinatum TaxID=74035 RepID=UPI00144A897B|nr:mitochondrial exoribonuclease Cyt-4 [Arthroderma uncinatum]KAF3480714.1 mitochondrial exoribonuclease Cyt-4 [Arthroderma uncinatum]
MSSRRWMKGTLDAPGKLGRQFICTQCASVLRRSLSRPIDASPGFTYSARLNRNVYLGSRVGRSFYSTDKASSSPDSSHIDDHTRQLIEQDLKRTDDIRTYLRKWIEKRPRPMDPIMDFSDVKHSSAPLPGSMFLDEVIFQDKRPELLDIGRSTDLENDPSPFLRPGDLVQLQHQGGFYPGQLAVYLRTVDGQQQFYTTRGKWRIARPSEVTFITKHRFPLELLLPIFPYLPTSAVAKGAMPQVATEGGVPRHIGAALLTLILEFETAVSAMYAENSGILHSVHERLAKETEPVMLTLEQIATQLFGRDPDTLTIPERYAIHLAVDQNPVSIIVNQSLSVVESYTFRPKVQANLINRVIKWMRDYQFPKDPDANQKAINTSNRNPIGLFIKNSRRRIQRSRMSRTPTHSFSLSPRSDAACNSENQEDQQKEPSKPSAEPFSETDRDIIEFLRLWVLPPQVRRDFTLRSTGSFILFHLGLYGNFNLNEATGYLALQELGVLTPWENIHVLNEQVALPGHGVSTISDAIVDECNRFCESASSTDTLVDSMKDFRKDWGDMPVFCVDSASAAEIDDGFSLESIPGSSDTYWIHIHVANPSAFIPHDHILAKGAAHFKRSFYAPERVYPMFPPSLTHDKFSLGPNKPTITFSAVINMSGVILDTKISHGRINNVIYITPNRLRKLFGIDDSHNPSISLEVGGVPKGPVRPELQDHISEEHRVILETMERLLAGRRDQRMKKGAIEFLSNHASSPLVSGDGVGIRSYVGDILGYHDYDDDPRIGISGQIMQSDGSLEATKTDLVSHAMLLGGEIAAQWCKERNIPVIFSAAAHRPDNLVTVDRDDSAPGLSPYSQLPRAFASSKPTPHATLGMDQYSKCTSPLRRYSDLIVHWQVEAALRHEARQHETEKNNESLSDIDESVLPFSRKAVKAIIKRSNWQNKVADRAQTLSREFWILQALFRAHYFGKTDIPETFQCIIVNQLAENSSLDTELGEVQYTANLLPFRVRCVVTADKNCQAFRSGDLVEASISSINLYAVFLDLQATRLISRPEASRATVPLGFIHRHH